ncbi:MAG: hypothetical protein DRQ41_11440 [Gammaproteobacteria bacterium]|nr:MAG: hypothetical protein DRQ41_11440 [Gammaproteobacteria bacterium]RKZ76028.1 MAG: hypothetical protein DRQ57_05260 [Gammaproteobacteria bacterium]
MADKFTYKPQNEAGEFTLTRQGEFMTIENTLGDLIPAFFRNSPLNKSLKPQTHLLEQPLFRGIVAELNQIDIFNHIPVYNFEVEQPKKASLIESQLDLEENTSNLAIVLQNILGVRI